MSVVNTQKHISFYKFTVINDPHALCECLRDFCVKRGLLGTVLLATEGVNGMLAGGFSEVSEFEKYLSTLFSGLIFKQSESGVQPFKKLLIKVKDQILTLRSEDLKFPFKRAEYIESETLNSWIKSKEDIVMIDVRNHFEFEYGTFDGAISPVTKNFSEFPTFIDQNIEKFKNKKVVTFCTGGIRCEKATALMLNRGLTNVFQLKDGIIDYLAKTDGEGFNGRCFVFDERITIEKES
jgi:UPF0176 protein